MSCSFASNPGKLCCAWVLPSNTITRSHCKNISWHFQGLFSTGYSQFYSLVINGCGKSNQTAAVGRTSHPPALNTVRSWGLYKDLGLACVSGNLIFSSDFILRLHHKKLRVAHSIFVAEAFDSQKNPQCSHFSECYLFFPFSQVLNMRHFALWKFILVHIHTHI